MNTVENINIATKDQAIILAPCAWCTKRAMYQVIWYTDTGQEDLVAAMEDRVFACMGHMYEWVAVIRGDDALADHIVKELRWA